jgi:hypothetical protein
MIEHSLSVNCSDIDKRSLSLDYDSDDKKHLWVKAFYLRDPEQDQIITVILDEEGARAALMFIQSFLLDLSRARAIEKYGDSAL